MNIDFAIFKLENCISASSMVYAFIAASASHQGIKSVIALSYLF